MPRIRSLKPEHRQHRKVGPLTDREFRLWIAMISEADDEGRLVCDAGQLRVLTWAYHPKVTTAQTEAAIQVLEHAGLISLYGVDGLRYAVFPSWHDHQHPKYPTPSRIPSPPEGLLQVSPNPPPGLPEDFPTRGVELRGVGVGVGVGLDREETRGVESRGEESEERGHTAGDASPAPPRSHSALSSNAPNPNGTGKRSPTYRRPGRGDFADTLREITARHPELSEAEREARALRVYHGGLTT